MSEMRCYSITSTKYPQIKVPHNVIIYLCEKNGLIAYLKALRNADLKCCSLLMMVVVVVGMQGINEKN